MARVPVDNAVDDLAGCDVDARHGVHVVHGDGAVVVDDKAAPLPAHKVTKSSSFITFNISVLVVAFNSLNFNRKGKIPESFHL